MLPGASGQTSALVLRVDGTADGMRVGSSVAGVGDWDGDGRDDVAVSTFADWTRVYSPQSGAVLFEVPVAGVVDDPGDFDGDGFRDLLIGGGSSAAVHSGADGSVLLALSGWSRYRAAGDVSGDGLVDFLVGDPSFDQGQLRYERRVLDEAPEVEAIALQGPPALCALMAVREAFGPAPDLVASGVNFGLNAGPAVMHSGTTQNSGASRTPPPRSASGRG